MDAMEGEYESRIQELQADLAAAKRGLDEHQQQLRQTEKEKASVLQELVEQNHRLTRELSQVSYVGDERSRLSGCTLFNSQVRLVCTTFRVNHAICLASRSRERLLRIGNNGRRRCRTSLPHIAAWCAFFRRTRMSG